ncbi:hypothetical protein KY289_007762 [Solanum tuberosum]|nr:hypothetical protein KY289_007762 [Solanum tuberosum]KAH0714599.1 hypothetical protein KY284_007504 [Solanum tuberosum]
MGSSQQPGSFGDPQQISSDNVNGLCLAISSSLFIGSSFIIKKKGLQKAAASGLRAGSGGYSYLMEPLWWAGMITMIVGEIANFAAYAFAPAVLVTPLGALSIIISAALAHMILGEKLHIFGMVGCVLCVVGSTTIVLHAPQERQIESVKELWDLATEPAFLLYATLVIVAVVIIIVQYAPKYGQTHIIAYVGVCSLVGSIGVGTQPSGYECPSTRNSIKINVLWDEPVVVSSNMGLCSCRSDMRFYTNELLKQDLTPLCGLLEHQEGCFFTWLAAKGAILTSENKEEDEDI